MARTEAMLEMPAARLAQNPPLLEARHVRRVLGTGDAANEVLSGVNLVVRRGEYACIKMICITRL